MVDITIETVHFPHGNTASLVRVPPTAAPDGIISALQLPKPRALLVLNGGTAKLEESLSRQLERHVADAVAQIATQAQITLVTGGTDAGVFALLGQGLNKWGRAAPCIGVAVDALAQRPGHPQGEAPLEPHHSHFVLVEGQNWGDETGTMYALIGELAKGCRSVAVFAGGGEITRQEMLANVEQGRTMILLAGSGRSTDAVLAAQAGNSGPGDERIARIVDSGLVVPFDLREQPSALLDILRSKLLGA